MRLLRAADDAVLALGFTPDGRVLVANHRKRGLFAWTLDTDRPPQPLGGASYSPCRDLHFDPDGRTVYWMTQNGRAGADVFTGHPAAADVQLGRMPVWFAQTSDGRSLFSARRPSAELFAWHRDGGVWSQVWRQPIADAFTNTLALDPRGERLTYIGEKPGPRWWPEYNQLVILDAASGQEIGHGNYRYENRDCTLLFRPDGRALIGLHNMTLLIWTAPKWGPPFERGNDTRKHFTAAAFDPSGRFLYTASNDAVVALWDAESWTRVRRYTWDIGPLKSLAVNPDGTLAAAGAENGTIVLWDVD